MRGFDARPIPHVLPKSIEMRNGPLSESLIVFQGKTMFFLYCLLEEICLGRCWIWVPPQHGRRLELVHAAFRARILGKGKVYPAVYGPCALFLPGL